MTSHHRSRKALRRGARASDRQGIPDAGALIAAQGHDADQGDVPQPSLRRHGRARAEDHRRVHLQAAQEAGERIAGEELHRDGVGPRLRAARADGSRRAHPGVGLHSQSKQKPRHLAGFFNSEGTRRLAKGPKCSSYY